MCWIYYSSGGGQFPSQITSIAVSSFKAFCNVVTNSDNFRISSSLWKFSSMYSITPVKSNSAAISISSHVGHFVYGSLAYGSLAYGSLAY
ncbi:MAG: hypothetical protein ACE5SW_12745 [Nitrososphaeraceae archaeon]